MNEYLISSFSQQWKKDPTSRVFFRLAEEYRKGGSYDKAIEVCTQGISHHPNYLPALMCLGRCHENLGHFTEAEDAYRKVLGFSPDNARALHGLSKICFESKRLDEAKQLLEMFLLNEPNDEAAQALLVQVIEQMQAESDSSVDAESDLLDDSAFDLGSDVEMLDDAAYDIAPDGEITDDSALEPLSDDDFLDVSEQPFAQETETTEELSFLNSDDIELEEPMPISPSQEASALTSFVSDQEIEADVGPDAHDLADDDILNVEDILDPQVLEEEQEVSEILDEDVLAVSVGDLSLDDPLGKMEAVNPGEPDLLTGAPRQLLPGNKSPLDALDLQFEQAIQEADKQAPVLFQELPPSVKPAGNPLTKKDEDKLTQGLKQEKMEHFEAAQHIYRSLLAKHPGDRLVSGHLERVNSRLATETKPNKKIRLLSNWLDKIKGVYHVR